MMNKKHNRTLGRAEKRRFELSALLRLLSYMKRYRGSVVIVIICILLSAAAGAASSLFLQPLIDDYIVPLLALSDPDFSGLARAVAAMGAVYLTGVASTLLYNRLMVTIAQSTLKTIRDEMFKKMQRLPIRYFDTHTHGETMSLYTNDTDTLRQLIAQSMAQLVSSVFTIAAVFMCMLYISVPLTAVAVITVIFSLRIAGASMKNVGSFFMRQQKALAELNGFVEEMINGQKVIKVFCREEQSKAQLRKKNKVWEDASAAANGSANAVMPLMCGLDYLQYVIIAVLGAYMAIAGMTNLGLTGLNTLSLGMIASFLTLTRSFTNPISQISNQLNSIVNALAGASRIFGFMEEEPETDEGYVTLVNAQTAPDGTLCECAERTGRWAWRHPHHDGTVSYTELRGEITMEHVDFGYIPEKKVLRDITLYAKAGQKVAFVGATGAGKTTI
ncbi:MAG: ABC transporter ATP-binding protein, partial [Candidatus Ornithomonoglobus sp.]